jgi:hypothetical protein
MPIHRFVFSFSISAALVLTCFNRGAEASSTAEVQLTILPLQCTLEKVDDGTNIVVRVIPQVCERVIGANASGGGATSPIKQ